MTTENSTQKIIIEYGTDDIKNDVSVFCYANLSNDNIIKIFSGEENRNILFSDNSAVSKKNVYLTIDGIVSFYDETLTISINLSNNKVTTVSDVDIENTLVGIQNSLTINNGSFSDENQMQSMVVRYLTGNEHVLEIGGHVGRTSLIIGSILGDNASANFVVMECDIDIMWLLSANRDINNMYFGVEGSALSKRGMVIQKPVMNSSGDIVFVQNKVDLISWSDLSAKYNTTFDTLVLDCNGGFFYIFTDMPEILDNIQTVILKNDFADSNKTYMVVDTLTNANFFVDYSHFGGEGPCYDNFFQVWKKHASNSSV